MTCYASYLCPFSKSQCISCWLSNSVVWMLGCFVLLRVGGKATSWCQDRKTAFFRHDQSCYSEHGSGSGDRAVPVSPSALRRMTHGLKTGTAASREARWELTVRPNSEAKHFMTFVNIFRDYQGRRSKRANKKQSISPILRRWLYDYVTMKNKGNSCVNGPDATLFVVAWLGGAGLCRIETNNRRR